jgi:hypothetical protein
MRICWSRSIRVIRRKYFAEMPQPQVAGAGQPGQQQADPSQGPGGVTAPQATNADTSPSHQASLAPSQFMQRTGAATGGASNV